MTSTLAQGVGRDPGKSGLPLRVLAASPALIVLLLGGLALRLVIAYVLFPSSGFASDVGSYASWALTLSDHGPAGFYANSGFADYPPAYLYLLWPVGWLASHGLDAGMSASGLVKLPPILLDIVVGYVIYRLVLGWSWPGRRAETLALAAAALYLFNPVSFYDSALWGQTDAAGALVVLLGTAALIRGNSEGAAALAALAALVKPQFGVVLIPLVAFLLLKRHLARPGSGPRHRPWAPAVLAGWLSRQRGWPRLATSALAALAVFFVVALPFGMGPVEYVERMFGTAAQYRWISVNAFNMWSLASSGGDPALAESLTWSSDTVAWLGPLPAVVIGAALLAAGYLWGLLRAAARDDRWTILVAVTFLAVAFFILPTRVHERYIFPAVALMPILAVVSGRWLIALLLLSAGAFINLHAILTIDIYGTDNVTSLPLGDQFRTQLFIIASALLQTGVGVWAAWQLRPSLRTSPDAFDRAAAPPVTGSTTARPWPEAPPQGYPVASVADAAPDQAGWVRGPSALDWLMARFTRPRFRRDRSAELRHERGGRIGRFDVLVFIALVIGAVALRGVNLEKPFGMYFDEVYHARTATEFLQHWEYGQSHDIYEFTHPHLAKYAMALGIRLAGGNRVTGSSDLGIPVVGAALERRWSEMPDGLRRGDRLYVGTGVGLHVYDLASRQQEAAFPIAATSLALDEVGHRLFIADPDGSLFVLDTTALDARRDGSGEPGGLEAFGSGPGGPVERLVVSDVSLVALAAAGSISTWDIDTGESLSQRLVEGLTDVVVLPWAERIVADTAAVEDAAGTADLLADALGDDADRLEELLAAGHLSVAMAAYPNEAARDTIVGLIDDGELPGISIESGPLLAVAGGDGVGLLDAITLDVLEETLTSEAAAAMVLVERGLDEPTLYVASGDSLDAIGVDEDGPGPPRSLAMPGDVRGLAWNEPANLVHALGDAPSGGPTVYVVEPNGNAVFIDVPLPAEPDFLLADTQPDRPDDDRAQLLAITPGGSISYVGIGGNAFGWRLPGVLLGALGAGLLYLLARVLFARRSVALIAAALIVVEGMLFANARIAMNDVYVGTFTIAAVLVFAPLYLASRRPLTALLALLATGLALGLALASKWVALYAIGGLVLLVLLRSGLGRVIALVGMIVMTAVLGALAVRPAPVDDPNLNWAFLVLMLVMTCLLAAGMVRRPLPIDRREVWLSVLGPIVIGAGLALLAIAQPAPVTEVLGGADGALPTGRLLIAAGLSVLVGAAVLLVAWLTARVGRGPFARAASRPDSSTSGWLRPDWGFGLPWLFTLSALVIVPVGVYVLAYAPWVDLGNQWGLPFLGSLPFLPEGGDGQPLPELTRSMYEYHDNLRAEHAASSPWWAWPLDLKPVWFYQERFAGPSTGLIYDAGNLVVFWLGIPAMAFAAWTAWRRRSPALAIVVLMWAAMWLPWARIDRATFQYHVYASLPFLVLALSYFLAELWHGPGIRVWFLARASVALVLLGVPLLWLLRTPLCILAGTGVAHPDGVACAAEVTRTAQLSEAGVTAMSIVAAGAGLAGFVAWRASRPQAERARRRADRTAMAPLVAIAIVGLAVLVGIVASFQFLDTSSPTAVTLSSDVLALMGLVVMAIPARMAIRARDARRFVLGVLVAAALWFLVWYPNISGLPLPGEFAHLYQGVLPTWNWDFQFAVNLDPAVEGGSIDLSTLAIGAITVLFVLATALAAHRWGRAARAADGVIPD